MKLQKKAYLLFWLIILILSPNLHAQVVIGQDGPVEDFIALKIVSTSGGLRYPQLTGTQITTLTGTINNNALANGLVVFNTDGTGSLQYYNGAGSWVNLSTLRNIAKSGAEDIVAFKGDSSIKIDDLVNNDYTAEYSIQSTINQDIQLKKVGKYLDYENIIKDIIVDIKDPSNRYKIQVKFYPKIKDLFEVNNNEGAVSFRLYATYTENGIEKQVDFIAQVTNIN